MLRLSILGPSLPQATSLPKINYPIIDSIIQLLNYQDILIYFYSNLNNAEK